MSDFIAVLLSRLEKIFDPQPLTKLLVEWMLNITVAIAVMAAFYLLWWLAKLVLRVSLRRKVDATTFSFIKTIVKFSLFIVAAITALDSAGIKTSALLTSLGIARTDHRFCRSRRPFQSHFRCSYLYRSSLCAWQSGGD